MNAFSKVDKIDFYRFVRDHAEQRYEFVEGYIVQQMTGATFRHQRLARRIGTSIEDRISSIEWTVTQERGIETPKTIRYADVAVEPAGASDDSRSTTTPALVVEILSQSTTEIDLLEKPAEYKSLASLQAYLVFSQWEAAVRIWLRNGAGVFPSQPQQFEGLDAVITIPQLDLNLPLAEIYRGIDLPSKDT